MCQLLLKQNTIYQFIFLGNITSQHIADKNKKQLLVKLIQQANL